ncbi:hypothetical protein ACA910_003626 [Epithemia clementina (nom. ined.)]
MTWRTTIATATAGDNRPLPLWLLPGEEQQQQQLGDEHEYTSRRVSSSLSALCGENVVQAMNELREDVSLVTNAFVAALD